MRHMKTSDLSLLRGMVDAGNEEAGNRLAELAAGREDWWSCAGWLTQATRRAATG